MSKLQSITTEEKFYIAGFLDGDGCINAQIIRKKDYVLKHQIRLSVTFYQKSTRAYFLDWLKDKIGVGTLRDNAGVIEYTIVGIPNVLPFLKELQPMLRIKSKQAELVLQICEALPPVVKSRNKEQFYELCKLVDLVGDLNDSKIRTVTALVVKNDDFFADMVDNLNNAPTQTILLEENTEE
jgi:hypothetical protein